jgi:hypothetical protein
MRLFSEAKCNWVVWTCTMSCKNLLIMKLSLCICVIDVCSRVFLFQICLSHKGLWRNWLSIYYQFPNTIDLNECTIGEDLCCSYRIKKSTPSIRGSVSISSGMDPIDKMMQITI